MTNEEVAAIVENEGLGYAVLDYMGSDEIKDPKLKDAWDRAEKALGEIRDILEPHMP